MSEGRPRAAPQSALAMLLTWVAISTGACSTGSSPATDAGTRTLPALCSAPRPLAQVPFPFNPDTRRRAKLLDLGDSHGGVRDFDDATVHDVATLLSERFLDPTDRQNEAPDAWTIFQFLCRHPTVLAGGYAVEKDRPDYRVSLDGIESERVYPQLLTDAQVLCREADEPRFDGVLDCWWD